MYYNKSLLLLLLTHITDVHEDASNPIFNKCGHGEIDQPRNWFSKSKSMDCNYHDFLKNKFTVHVYSKINLQSIFSPHIHIRNIKWIALPVWA